MRKRWRSRRDDVDIESFLANLHRVADDATAPLRRIIDLRRASHADEVRLDEGATRIEDARTRR